MLLSNISSVKVPMGAEFGGAAVAYVARPRFMNASLAREADGLISV